MNVALQAVVKIYILIFFCNLLFSLMGCQKWTVIVNTAGHINHCEDKCPQWTEMVEKSTLTVLWKVIVVAATTTVHVGQLSLVDSYRHYNYARFEYINTCLCEGVKVALTVSILF